MGTNLDFPLLFASLFCTASAIVKPALPTTKTRNDSRIAEGISSSSPHGTSCAVDASLASRGARIIDLTRRRNTAYSDEETIYRIDPIVVSAIVLRCFPLRPKE